MQHCWHETTAELLYCTDLAYLEIPEAAYHYQITC